MNSEGLSLLLLFSWAVKRKEVRNLVGLKRVPTKPIYSEIEACNKELTGAQVSFWSLFLMKEKARGNPKNHLKIPVETFSTKIKVNYLYNRQLKGLKGEYSPLTCW
jgi:hypothetical protein